MATVENTPSEPVNTAVPHPVFELAYNRKNITHDITPYVLSVTYTDHLSGKSDELDVTLEDVDGRWIDAWYPGKGDTISLKIGYLGESLLPCGSFVIDEIEYEHPPSVVSIKALAAPVSKSIRTRKSAPYENTTLAAICSRVAKRNGLTLVGKIADIKVGRETQYQEHDVEFLKRLGGEYGYAFKVVGDKLVFTELEDLHNKAAVASMPGAELTSLRFKDKIKGVVASATGKHQDSSNKKLVSYSVKNDGDVAKSGDTLKLSTRAGSKAELETKTRAAMNSASSEQRTGAVTAIGNARLVAGNSVEITGVGKFSGKYLIESARHRISRQAGYTTELELKTGTQNKGNGQLKVYGMKGQDNVAVVGHTAKKEKKS